MNNFSIFQEVKNDDGATTSTMVTIRLKSFLSNGSQKIKSCLRRAVRQFAMFEPDPHRGHLRFTGPILLEDQRKRCTYMLSTQANAFSWTFPIAEQRTISSDKYMFEFL